MIDLHNDPGDEEDGEEKEVVVKGFGHSGAAGSATHLVYTMSDHRAGPSTVTRTESRAAAFIIAIEVSGSERAPLIGPVPSQLTKRGTVKGGLLAAGMRAGSGRGRFVGTESAALAVLAAPRVLGGFID